MAKARKAELETIPDILEKATGLINREIENLMHKDSISEEDSRILISYCHHLSNIYKDYRAERKQIQEDLRGKSLVDIQNLIKADGQLER